MLHGVRGCVDTVVCLETSAGLYRGNVTWSRKSSPAKPNSSSPTKKENEEEDESSRPFEGSKILAVLIGSMVSSAANQNSPLQHE